MHQHEYTIIANRGLKQKNNLEMRQRDKKKTFTKGTNLIDIHGSKS